MFQTWWIREKEVTDAGCLQGALSYSLLVPSLYCTLWLHISITDNAAMLYVLYLYLVLSETLRMDLHEKTLKDILWYVFHLQPFVRFEWITREREVYVSAGAKFFAENIRVFTAIEWSKASWSWRLWRQSSSLGGPTRGALSHHQFNLEDVDQQRLASDVS